MRCTRGAIFDAVVDLRAGSPTRGRHVAVELTAEEGTPGSTCRPAFAHGFQTLADATEVLYQMSEAYVAGARPGLPLGRSGGGHRLAAAVTVISERDRELPPFAGSVTRWARRSTSSPRDLDVTVAGAAMHAFAGEL